MEHTQNSPSSLNSIIGLAMGLLVWAYDFFINIHAHPLFDEKIIVGVVTAVLYGFSGLLGKEMFLWVKRAYKEMRTEYKRKKNK